MSEKLWAKICFEGEGVVSEKKYETEAEAQAFVDGATKMKEALDSDDDSHFACTGDEEAVSDE